MFYFTCNRRISGTLALSEKYGGYMSNKTLKLFQTYFSNIEHVGKYS